MNIDKINRKHLVETDMFYRVAKGLSSKLLKYNNGVMFLEVILSKKWNKSYSITASELAHCWKNAHDELSNSIACKVYIIDTKSYNYKQFLLHKGLKPGYDAKKGVIFNRYCLN